MKVVKNKKINAPFTNEQVDNLNKFQKKLSKEPFTCSGEFCDKHEMIRAGFKRSGLLLATNEGWICPCGRYKKGWAYEFMASINK